MAKLDKRFPLIDWGWTEADCLQFCYDNGITFGGLYEHFSRLSCWCCPLHTIQELRDLYHFYPEKWEELKDMDDRSRNKYSDAGSVRELEERFKREDAQGRLF